MSSTSLVQIRWLIRRQMSTSIASSCSFYPASGYLVRPTSYFPAAFPINFHGQDVLCTSSIFFNHFLFSISVRTAARIGCDRLFIMFFGCPESIWARFVHLLIPPSSSSQYPQNLSSFDNGFKYALSMPSMSPLASQFPLPSHDLRAATCCVLLQHQSPIVSFFYSRTGYHDRPSVSSLFWENVSVLRNFAFPCYGWYLRLDTSSPLRPVGQKSLPRCKSSISNHCLHWPVCL